MPARPRGIIKPVHVTFHKKVPIMNTSSNIPLNNQRTGGGTNATHIATMANASSDSSNKNNMVVPASRPLQWPSATAGLTVLQQQRLQMDFEEKRKLLEAQQKSKLGELQNKLKAQMVCVMCYILHFEFGRYIRGNVFHFKNRLRSNSGMRQIRKFYRINKEYYSNIKQLLPKPQPRVVGRMVP